MHFSNLYLPYLFISKFPRLKLFAPKLRHNKVTVKILNKHETAQALILFYFLVGLKPKWIFQQTYRRKAVPVLYGFFVSISNQNILQNFIQKYIRVLLIKQDEIKPPRHLPSTQNGVMQNIISVCTELDILTFDTTLDKNFFLANVKIINSFGAPAILSQNVIKILLQTAKIPF